ncbi:hypothetical protein HF288_05680 [Acidithiobacillus caldus]|jgi:hypothetical protein|uniref:hypothetical protein n=1 Tax=Acidithiobacillus caldus TaxID=33059 RepID=UPI001C065491|nr:hypothetical protein [Acidithiobacillus caldus]MBU2790992.1 hypothetical protein [Acidithiobacillus caldus]MBU2820815.1 hypothetical protein [Acidithiobacillus caldus]
MLDLPSPIPAGTSPIRIPRSKAATLRLLLETVQRGSRYWTGGIIPTHKALHLAEKFADRYSCTASAATRSRNKARGISNATLIFYPENASTLTPLRWWLLVTPGTGRVWEEEQLQDTGKRRERLRWGDQYGLVHLQRDKKHGGGRHWTWCIQEAHYEALEDAMRQYASAHGKKDATERTDDLERLLTTLRRMPGFHGIRRQQWALYTLGRNCWDRTHKSSWGGWPTEIPYADKRQPVYHRPEPLRLDVLVAMAVRKTAVESC